MHIVTFYKGGDKVLSQTVADIPTEEERLAPAGGSFIFFLCPGEIYGNACVQRASSNERRDDCQEFNENWVNSTYISARAQAQAQARRGLLTK